jgi:nitrite reductase (NO-forming)
MSRRIFQLFVLGVIAAILLSACRVESQNDSMPMPPTATAGGADKNAALVPVQAGASSPNVHFTLKTGMGDGKMIFIGVGGALEGKANPDLAIKPGDVVEITLINGDNILHDVTLPDFGVGSDKISKQGSEAKVVFKALQVGVFPYFCSLPGHRQAGMEGKLVVGSPAAAGEKTLASVVRAPEDLPAALHRSTPQKVQIDLTTTEVMGRLADGTSYVYWTFNGKVPGPFLRVRVGDTVEVHLKNATTSTMPHSVDFHAVTGPGGGAVATQTKPGEETSFTFKAMNPGLFVYHCATTMVAHHIANGMYGLILVEPEGGLPAVDREFYVMQGEVYTEQAMGVKADDTFSLQKLLDEHPEYLVFNGAVGGLTSEHPLRAQVGETVRIFFGVGGPNFTSSFHVIGEIFDRVYSQASLTSQPLTDVQTTLVPPGGATMVEFKLQVPGRYILVDHALSRMERGLAGYLLVEGPDAPDIFDGKMTPGSGH